MNSNFKLLVLLLNYYIFILILIFILVVRLKLCFLLLLFFIVAEMNLMRMFLRFFFSLSVIRSQKSISGLSTFFKFLILLFYLWIKLVVGLIWIYDTHIFYLFKFLFQLYFIELLLFFIWLNLMINLWYWFLYLHFFFKLFILILLLLWIEIDKWIFSKSLFRIRRRQHAYKFIIAYHWGVRHWVGFIVVKHQISFFLVSFNWIRQISIWEIF